MRFSIVFDDYGTILGAVVGDEEADRPTLGPGVNSGYFDISGSSDMGMGGEVGAGVLIRG